MREVYFVNGWREGKNYFKRLGCFSADEWEQMQSGETIIKENNEYRIEKVLI